MINKEMGLIEDWGKLEMRSMRDGFGMGLVEAAERDGRVVVVCADLKESTKVDGFAREFPDRFIEVGVAEQNMMGVAAGLALSEKVPVAVSYGVFSPGRNWDQLRVSVCYSQTNVKVIGTHAGISVGADGATHQALEDIAITRVLPNLVVLAPADVNEARKAIMAAISWQGPVYIRLNRNKTGVMTTTMSPFEIGKARVWREGEAVTVVACGAMVIEAMLAADELKNEIDVEVINMATIKPFDEETLLRSVKKTGRVVTVEEHQIIGGLGSAVAEVLGEKLPTPLVRVGMKDSFGESGSSEELLHKYGLDKKTIIEAIRSSMTK
jgi:transketolase